MEVLVYKLYVLELNASTYTLYQRKTSKQGKSRKQNITHHQTLESALYALYNRLLIANLKSDTNYRPTLLALHHKVTSTKAEFNELLKPKSPITLSKALK